MVQRGQLCITLIYGSHYLLGGYDITIVQCQTLPCDAFEVTNYYRAYYLTQLLTHSSTILLCPLHCLTLMNDT